VSISLTVVATNAQRKWVTQLPKHRDTCDTCVSRPASELHVFPTATKRISGRGCVMSVADVQACQDDAENRARSHRDAAIAYVRS
jgi:hypothetical protein